MGGIFKIILSESFCFIVEIAIASPIANCITVDEVGTILPGPASLTSGNNIFISEFL